MHLELSNGMLHDTYTELGLTRILYFKMEETFDYATWAADEIASFKEQCRYNQWTDEDKEFFYMEHCDCINFMFTSEFIRMFVNMSKKYITKNHPGKRDIALKACRAIKSQFPNMKTDELDHFMESLQ